MIVLDLAPRQPEVRDADLIRVRMAAEERVIADVDSFTEWLSVQCKHARPDPFGYIPRDAGRRLQFIESLTVPQLTAGLLHAQIAGDCANRLREVYLADAGTQAYIQRLADETHIPDERERREDYRAEAA